LNNLNYLNNVNCQLFPIFESFNNQPLNTMKKLFFTAALSFVAFTSFSQKIYSTNSEYSADVKVFVVSSEYSADLKVYKSSSEYSVGNNEGKWFFTSSEYSADKKNFFVNSEYSANLKIYLFDS